MTRRRDGTPAIGCERDRVGEGGEPRCEHVPLGETLVRLDGQTVLTVVGFGETGAASLLGVYTLERALLAVDPVRRRLVPADALLMTAPDELVVRADPVNLPAKAGR